MRRSAMLVPLLILASCATRIAAAQEPALAPGARVRVTFPDAPRRPLVGVVESTGDGTIRVRTRRDVVSALELSRVERLEVSLGQYRPTWSKTAPLWLTAAAGAAGASLGYVTASDDDFFGREGGAAIGGVAAGALGLVIGTGMAIFVKEDRWQSVLDSAGRARSTAAKPSLYVAPGASGIRLGMRASF